LRALLLRQEGLPGDEARPRGIDYLAIDDDEPSVIEGYFCERTEIALIDPARTPESAA
jgi:hypothetical protein